MDDKPKISRKRYLGGLARGLESWTGFSVIGIPECKNDCKI
jgi:hypothetical protein